MRQMSSLYAPCPSAYVKRDSQAVKEWPASDSLSGPFLSVHANEEAGTRTGNACQPRFRSVETAPPEALGCHQINVIGVGGLGSP